MSYDGEGIEEPDLFYIAGEIDDCITLESSLDVS